MSASTPNAFLNIDDAHLRVTSGNVYAQGLNISGISFSGVSGLQTVTNTGNVTTNTLEFKNGEKAFVATSNVDVKGSLDVANVATIYNGSNADYDQKQKFTSTVSASGNYFSNTLAVSTNGLYAIVGAHGEDKAYTFTRSGSTWTQENIFSSTTGSAFGYAVDISSDGTYAIVGGNGSASVFYRSSGSTWDSGTTLTAGGISVTTGYGASVSISDDGSYAIVGATGQNAAYIFRRTGTTTWDAGVKIALTGFTLGFSVAISGDGLYALLGAHAQHTAYVFKRTGAYIWSQQVKITESDSFGYSVALSTDGSRALIGAMGGNGKAYSYERSGSDWSQNAIITASDAASGDAFGSAVSLSSDGSYALVGAPGNEKAYTFKNAGTVWTELGIETASDATAGHVFGRSVSISGDGIYALMGASGNEAVYSYERKETLVLDVRGEANVRTLNVSDDLTSNNLTVAGNLNVTTIRSDSNVVAEYTGPHDRPLRKYPEVALTSASDSGYVVTRSSENTASQHYAWELFDNNSATKWLATSGDSYSTTSPFLYNGTNNSTVIDVTNTPHNGAWVKLQLPVSIKLSHVIQRDNDNPSNRVPGVVTFLGSNNGSDWTFLKEFTGLSNAVVTETMYVNSTVAYSHYAYIVKNLSDADGQLDLGELEYYGYEEGSGSLDTTLKTVYNVPATTGTQLEVYYDAKDLADGNAPTNPVDLSPNTNNATLGGDPQVSNGAFVFDGSGDAIVSSGTSTSLDGNATFSISLWSKTNTVSSGSNALFMLGYWSTNKSSGLRIDASTGTYRFFTTNGVSKTSQTTALLNEWTHITLIHEGTSGYKFYVNGVFTDEITVDNDLSLDSNPRVALGNYINSSGVVTGTASYDGSIANFRLYSKALNAGQVQELYDYQKDYFLGSKSQVTLYKGHLGVGVTEPSGQLELAGDERIQEYPPRGLIGDKFVGDSEGPGAYDYNVEGHGVFKLLSSYDYHTGIATSTPDDRRIYRLFDKSNDTLTHWSSFNSSDPYDAAGGSGAWVTTLDGGSTITAHIAEIQMPYKITLKKYILTSSSQVPRALKTGMIVGSNDGNVFHVLDSVSDFGFTATYQPKEYTVDNTTTPYRIFRLLLMNTNGHQTCNMNEWRLFGTPGPTTLDKGSLTLGRSLDVPRVSRYDVDTETPRPEKLVVDFDTTVNSSPTDISGKGNHGTFNGTDMNYSAADKAFVFNGSDDYIYLEQSDIAGTSATHTFSLWINALSGPGNGSYEAIFEGGVRSSNQAFGAYVYQDGSNTRVYYHVFGNNLPSDTAGYIINTNSWYHICGTLDNSGNVRRFYVNGELFASDTYGSLNVTHPRIRIGENVNGSETWHGMVSNFKLYNVALEPSEVKKLYNLGRTGRSMVISDTAVGIGKAPEAQLDVRGVIRGPGLSIQTVSSTKTDTSFFSGTSVTDIGGLSITIQPKFANSKIYVGYHILYGGWGRNFFRLKRTQGSSTSYFQSDLGPNDHASTGRATTTDAFANDDASTRSGSFFTLDDANGLEPITYTVQGWTYHSVYYVCVNRGYDDGYAGIETYRGRGASSITAQEVCQ